MPWFCVIWIKVCGTWLGYPSKRRRNLSWSWNRDRLIWTGPAEQKDVQADFDRLFHRKIMLPGDVFCAAPDEYVAGVYGHAMGKRFCSLPDGQNVDVRGRRMLASILTPAQLQRLHAYEETHEAKHGTPPGLGSPLIADIMQWPGMPGDSSEPCSRPSSSMACIIALLPAVSSWDWRAWSRTASTCSSLMVHHGRPL